ncbi:aldose epimerase family protein [Komagataeibacter medellinensis]|uniref:Aldose 1-epimerase n=1 Tax=Komagataeibacter medellinensis (strain NBRC 3288 / BCRC 11682 / LMG 1693 / Kondo 51) TaxID=634177 RepID=G2I712_KOMMN|nr:aldose epimerase family protein [Komagataeibacter medellinensis]BAK83909.1 aldose 1-epimerase [Komagataeibacter medellinensis NBRC 3288]
MRATLPCKSHLLLLATWLLAALPATVAWATPQPVTITRAPFGTLADGQTVEQFTLANGRGMSVRVMTYGAIITAIDVPDRWGHVADVVLGFPTLEGYVVNNPRGSLYFGATVGRVANRIRGGSFTLDGRTYHIPQTEGTNALHGGRQGFDRHVWSVETITTTPQAASVTLMRVSPDGEEGFPGTLTTHVTFGLNTRNELSLHYRATTDRPTVVNLTNHSYFNLGGEGSGSVESEILQIHADTFTPVDAQSLPLGTIAPVAGTALDFRMPRRIGAGLRDGGQQMLFQRGYDHNWIVGGTPTRAPIPAAHLSDPASGRNMDVLTTQPGLQVYTANALDGRYSGPAGHAYRQTDAVALEAEHYPDSPNHPDFPTITLRPGETYDQTTIYRLGVEPMGHGTP